MVKISKKANTSMVLEEKIKTAFHPTLKAEFLCGRLGLEAQNEEQLHSPLSSVGLILSINLCL